ncbi:MAG: hypothetical protein IJ511_10190 [Bacteroides sp.]|nr:hypothetical protein [Bacteroides sp.]
MKNLLLGMVLAGLPSMFVQAQNTSVSVNPEYVNSVTARSKVCGDGRKVATVVIAYEETIRNRSLSAATYQVEGAEIQKVYANTQPEVATAGKNGPYVIIELKAETDMNAQPRKATPEDEAKRKERDRMQGGPGLKAGWSTGGDDVYPGNAVVRQVAAIKTVKGKVYPALDTPMESTEEHCEVVDEFRQLEFKSPYTGQVLPYNLYLPQDYDPAVKYPLVLFIHDAGAVGGPVEHTLVQGRGAVVWASPESQARQKCIVVAPQYPFVTVDDNWNYSHHLDATIELLKELQARYSIDSNRIYTTGQSMGCMSSIVLMLKEPDLFAGALLVAGKWNPELMPPLARQNIWIISCEGDAHSMQLQSEAVDLWRKGGERVAEATWPMDAAPEALTDSVAAMRQQDTHLLFTRLRGGNHRATWFMAYDIEGVRDWLFEQRRPAHEAALARPTAKTDWTDPVKETPENTHYVTYPTLQRGEGTQSSFMVYLPDSYGSTDRRYPVIYYLHGGTGNQREATWMIRKIHAAIQAGRMDPVMVVAPQAMPIGWYVNGNRTDPKVQTGPIEDVLIKDLIPYVDRHYLTVASAKGRALEGFSMGGCGSLRLAFKYPELFGAVSSVAGAVVNWEEEHMTRALECTFGDVNNPASKAYFDALHPAVFATRNASLIRKSGMKVRLFVGTADKLYNDNGTPITTRFHELLEQLGIAHTYDIVPGANHSPRQLFAPGRLTYDVEFWNTAFKEATSPARR